MIQRPIVIGVLYSSTGKMASSEVPVIKAIQLAAKEINLSGGINGRKIQLVVEDPKSEHANDALLAKKLIVEHNAMIIIGCWTSVCRKAVKPIVEKYEALLIYPNQYEGVEQSNHILYLGATPNQQSIPAVNWMMKKYGKKVFLVGSDYIYPHIAAELSKLQIHAQGGDVVGSLFVNKEGSNLAQVIEEIKRLKPDFIVNNINGENNIDFFDGLYDKRDPYTKPTISFSLSDSEIEKIKPFAYPNMYSAWTYYRVLNNPKNIEFLKKYRAMYGSDKDVNDPAATAYAALYLLKQGIVNAYVYNPQVIKDSILRSSVASPAGVLYVDGFNGHAWRQAMVAKLNQDASYQILWRSNHPIEPKVYPLYKTRVEWELMEYELFMRWNKSWENNQ